MTREEYLKMEKEAREEFEKMSPEEKKAHLAAQKRHERKVRDEIITSHEIRKQKNKKNNDESASDN